VASTQVNKWILAAVLAAVGVALLSQAVAFAATSPSASSATSAAPAAPAVTAPTASTDFVQAMFDLRERQMTEMQTWLDKYGADLTSAQAQKVLLDLHDKYFAAYSKLLERYGVAFDGPWHGYGLWSRYDGLRRRTGYGGRLWAVAPGLARRDRGWHHPPLLVNLTVDTDHVLEGTFGGLMRRMP
jgi:hypothetical protein